MDLQRVILRIALFSMFIKTALVLSFISIVFTGCSDTTIALKSNITSNNTIKTPHNIKDEFLVPYVREPIESFRTPVEATHQVQETTIAAVGDLMFHNTQLTRAYNQSTGSFDFSTIFTFMKPYLMIPDLLLGNLETTFYGPYGSTTNMTDQNVYGYSGYPMFNTPDSALLAIKDAGFDFLSTANNHALDKRTQGLLRTIEQIDELSIGHTGTFSSLEKRVPYEQVTINGLTFAIVNYTYATNGITLPEDQMQLINTLDNYNISSIDKLYADVESAHLADVDFVIVMMHYGNEYQAFEDQRFQRPITENLLRKGADIVFGGHPHVMQPIEIYDELDGIRLDAPKIVIYSLGNFLASQRNIDKIGGNTDLGVVFQLYITQIDRQKPKIKGIGFIPTYTIWQRDTIMTVPINDTFAWDTDQIYMYGQNSTIPLTLSPWDEARIKFAKSYTLLHLMSYESKKELLGDPYYDQGVYRYDFK